mmetsp:Transcript_8091/g.11246  ORF Transcript_8091/g.11246 Transcript_8091/m.11246 type:complete len:110 (+) Transcript_8091:512-841(+)
MKINGGPPKYIHDEKSAMSDIGFQFMQRSGALPYAKARANALGSWNDSDGSQDCPIEELLYKNYAKRVWRPDEIGRYLEMLTPNNCYVCHVSKDYSSEADLQTEPIYTT